MTAPLIPLSLPILSTSSSKWASSVHKARSLTPHGTMPHTMLAAAGSPKWGSQQGGCRTPAGACGHARIRAFRAAATPWCNCLRGWMRASSQVWLTPLALDHSPQRPLPQSPDTLISPRPHRSKPIHHTAPCHYGFPGRASAGAAGPRRSSVQTVGLAHGRLDVEAAHVLPVLLQQRHQEVDGHLGGAAAPRQSPTTPHLPVAIACKRNNGTCMCRNLHEAAGK